MVTKLVSHIVSCMMTDTYEQHSWEEDLSESLVASNAYKSFVTSFLKESAPKWTCAK